MNQENLPPDPPQEISPANGQDLHDAPGAVAASRTPSEQKEKVGDVIGDDEGRRPERYTEYYVGHLPPPDYFAGYERVLPGAADRILALTEGQQRARESNDNKLLSNDRVRIYGVILGHIAIVGVIGLSAWLENTILAVSLGLAEVASAWMGLKYGERPTRKADEVKPNR